MELRFCANPAAALFASPVFQTSAPGWYCTTCSQRKAPGTTATRHTTPRPRGACELPRRLFSDALYETAHRAEYRSPPPRDDPDKAGRIENLEGLEYDLTDTVVCDGTEYVWENRVLDEHAVALGERT